MEQPASLYSVSRDRGRQAVGLRSELPMNVRSVTCHRKNMNTVRIRRKPKKYGSANIPAAPK